MFSRGLLERKDLGLAPQVGFEPTTLRLTAALFTLQNKAVINLFNRLYSHPIAALCLFLDGFLSFVPKVSPKVKPISRENSATFSETLNWGLPW